MRCPLFFLAWISSFSLLEGQTTFNHRFHFDTPATYLTSIVPTDSCYYATGIYADTLPFLQVGSLFVKFDLQGTPVFVKKLISPEKSYETRTHTLTDLEDGTFVLTGLSFDPAMKGMLIKYDKNGDTLWTKEYLNPFYPLQEFMHPLALARMPDGGFVLACWTNKSDFDPDIYLIRTDSIGNKIWGKFYGNSIWDQPESILTTTTGDIIVGGVRTNLNSVAQNYVFQCHIFRTDSTGSVVWDYFTSVNQGLIDAANDMVLLEDSSLAIASGKGTEYERPSVNVVWFEKMIFKLKPDKQISWQKEFVGDHPTLFTKLSNIVKLQNGSGFVTTGTSPMPIVNPGGDKWGVYGWIGKVSPQGDSLWNREYGIVTTNSWSHDIYDIRETTDGSFIMCGEARDWSGTDSIPQQAWLLKLDQYGCLVPNCYTATEEAPTGEEPAIRLAIYPNPTADYLNFYLRTPRPVKEASFRIVSAEGRLVQSFQSDRPDVTFIVPVWDWAAGVYFLQYLEEGMVKGSERFVVQR